MLFNIELDNGQIVIGYFVPDRFSGRPATRIAGSGIGPIMLRDNESRESLVVAGRHETGLCGFSFGQDVVPGLAEMQDLEIYDPETGIVLYRRRPADSVIKQKLLRLETHLAPLVQLDDALDRSFR